MKEWIYIVKMVLRGKMADSKNHVKIETEPSQVR
jgi:hypothetical protein